MGFFTAIKGLLCSFIGEDPESKASRYDLYNKGWKHHRFDKYRHTPTYKYLNLLIYRVIQSGESEIWFRATNEIPIDNWTSDLEEPVPRHGKCVVVEFGATKSECPSADLILSLASDIESMGRGWSAGPGLWFPYCENLSKVENSDESQLTCLYRVHFEFKEGYMFGLKIGDKICDEKALFHYGKNMKHAK